MSIHPSEPDRPARNPWRRVAERCLLLMGTYVLLAYVVLPTFWTGYFRLHPALDSAPRVTQTSVGRPGDPLNVALVGEQDELKAAMLAAKWFSADPLSLRSDIKIAEATVLKRPYDNAPVSSLYLFGRPEDLAFEQPVGRDPRQRHHVRFWKCAELDVEGRSLWIGSATYDRRVGLSRNTGQITHHIDADVDAERDHLLSDLSRAGWLEQVQVRKDFQPTLRGTNGGGDPWFTDGSLRIGTLQAR